MPKEILRPLQMPHIGPSWGGSRPIMSVKGNTCNALDSDKSFYRKQEIAGAAINVQVAFNNTDNKESLDFHITHLVEQILYDLTPVAAQIRSFFDE